MFTAVAPVTRVAKRRIVPRLRAALTRNPRSPRSPRSPRPCPARAPAGALIARVNPPPTRPQAH